MWYKFTAYNSQNLYGWTTNPAVSDLSLKRVNKDREINVYAMTTVIDPDEIADIESMGDGYIFDDDTTPDDIDA